MWQLSRTEETANLTLVPTTLPWTTSYFEYCANCGPYERQPGIGDSFVRWVHDKTYVGNIGSFESVSFQLS